MSAVPIPELRVIPLAEVHTATGMPFGQALIEFADELAAVPRYFGSGAIPRPSSRWRSMLSHPASVNGVAALVDGELVGVARLSARATGGAHLMLAVATPWRRRGIGATLVQAAVTMAAHQNLVPVVAITEHRKAPVQVLAERFSVPFVEAPQFHLAS